MESELVNRLVDKSITKDELLGKVERNFALLSDVLKGISSPKAAIRYGCSSMLMDLSEKNPEKLYPYMDFFIGLLDNKYKILTWNALVIIANLTEVDRGQKFDSLFDKYYDFLDDEYMVTVANVVDNSAKIAHAKPYLLQKITNRLLETADISVTPHLTEECKKVIAEKSIKVFDLFFDKIEDKERVISFVKPHLESSRKTLRLEAANFLRKWNK